MNEPKVAGSCLCGAVRFEVTLPPKWCANCHCSMCRRAHAAPYVTWVGFEASAFRMAEGSATPVSYRSSDRATRTFCGTCGSPLTFVSDRWAGEVHVARACLPDPLDLAPMAHAFFSDRAPWLALHDDLPKLGGPTGTEPL